MCSCLKIGKIENSYSVEQTILHFIGLMDRSGYLLSPIVLVLVPVPVSVPVPLCVNAQ